VWQPKRGGKEKDVPEATATFPDQRASHFWDGEGWTVQHYKAVLGINVDAWDLYLIYGADARWDGAEPPKPIFWMHQLWGVDNGPPLDADVFGARVKDALAAMPGAR
jgi:hypothetical protein